MRRDILGGSYNKRRWLVGYKKQREIIPRALIRAVDSNSIRNLPIDKADTVNTDRIYGPIVTGLKGRTTRKKPSHVSNEHQHIPASLHQRYKLVTLGGDVFFVERLRFLISKSRYIRFTTTQPTSKQDTKTLFEAIRLIKQVYLNGGFDVNKVFTDRQFESLRAPLASICIQLNTTSVSEHVPEVERHIQTLKEHLRATLHLTPYKRFPSRMIHEGVIGTNYWMNSFGPLDGIHPTIPPRTIVTGIPNNHGKHMLIPFGQYTQVHVEGGNTMNPRTVGAIALRQGGNRQGSIRFLSLHTGRIVTGRSWTVIPIPPPRAKVTSQ